MLEEKGTQKGTQKGGLSLPKITVPKIGSSGSSKTKSKKATGSKKATTATTTTDLLGSLTSSAKATATKAADAVATTAVVGSLGYTGKDADTATEVIAGAGGVSGITKWTAKLKSFFTWVGQVFTFAEGIPKWQSVLAWLIVLAALAGIIYAIYASVKKANPQTAAPSEGLNPNAAPPTVAGTPTAAAAGAPTPTTEGFQTVEASSVSKRDATLVNLQPLTISQAGYTGAAASGAFDPELGITEALKAGFRSFVLQIDYLDSGKGAGFEEPGLPTLVYRAANGDLLSTNSGSIRKVAELIASIAYRPDVPKYTDPVILYLHVLRTPSPIRRPEDYLKFLSKIAEALNPLAPNHLGLTPLGDFHRQKRESDILNLPFSSMEGKTIILCNADTSMFRSGSGSRSSSGKAGGKRYAAADDLDYWVNMRVYLENDSTMIGVTQTPESDKKAMAVLTRVNDLTPMINQKADAFAMKGKRRFVIAMPQPDRNPTAAEVSRLINEFGVNMVPINIFAETPENLKAIVGEYSSMSYRPKPETLRKVSA